MGSMPIGLEYQGEWLDESTFVVEVLPCHEQPRADHRRRAAATVRDGSASARVARDGKRDGRRGGLPPLPSVRRSRRTSSTPPPRTSTTPIAARRRRHDQCHLQPADRLARLRREALVDRLLRFDPPIGTDYSASGTTMPPPSPATATALRRPSSVQPRRLCPSSAPTSRRASCATARHVARLIGGGAPAWRPVSARRSARHIPSEPDSPSPSPSTSSHLTLPDAQARHAAVLEVSDLDNLDYASNGDQVTIRTTAPPTSVPSRPTGGASMRSSRSTSRRETTWAVDRRLHL